jgi:hypothetical protein
MEATCARSGRSEERGGELVTCASLGEHRGVSLGVLDRAPEAEGATSAEEATWKGDGHANK